jgi:hypothetical protein
MTIDEVIRWHRTQSNGYSAFSGAESRMARHHDECADAIEALREMCRQLDEKRAVCGVPGRLSDQPINRELMNRLSSDKDYAEAFLAACDTQGVLNIAERNWSKK